MEDGVYTQRPFGRLLGCVVACGREAPVPTKGRAKTEKDYLAESSRAALLGSGVQLRFAMYCAGSDSHDHAAVLQSCDGSIAAGPEIYLLDASARLGSRLFLLGLGGGSLCCW